jgi:hypothetical protein
MSEILAGKDQRHRELSVRTMMQVLLDMLILMQVTKTILPLHILENLNQAAMQ